MTASRALAGLAALANAFGRIAMSFLQYPHAGDVRIALEPFVRGGLSYSAEGAKPPPSH